MSNYCDFVKNYFSVGESTCNEKYCDVGHTFCFNTEEAEGIYWFYEGENFIIDIHDTFIKKKLFTQVLQAWTTIILFIFLT